MGRAAGAAVRRVQSSVAAAGWAVRLREVPQMRRPRVANSLGFQRPVARRESGNRMHDVLGDIIHHDFGLADCGAAKE
jgi:hypothetical protein